MLDMINLGLVAVGNDSETTSQYGGTGHAGDIGAMPKDRYGIDTSIGTGRRVARVALTQLSATEFALVERLRLGFWILQDRDHEISRRIGPFLDEISNAVTVCPADLLGNPVRPCIACDICPTHVGLDEEYRCIIRRSDDALVNAHGRLLEADIIIPAVFSPRDREGLKSVYQQFMERTRYIRRGDYAFTDRLVAPLVFAEIGANENLDIRMMTSFLRHHTVMHRPIVGWIHEGKLLNPEDIRLGLRTAIDLARQLVLGRLGLTALGATATQYHPVGYILAQAKDNEPATLDEREKAALARKTRLVDQCHARLVPIKGDNALPGRDD